MQKSDFEHVVAEGYRKLPQWVKDKIKNVALLIEDEPSRQVREHERLAEDETLLGYYQGIPLVHRGEQYGVGATMPDTITLYRLPIEEEANDDPERIREVVADTVWHEFAHHFGMDEYEVRQRERKRSRK